ncbi:hypothetical protein ZWY2020_025375 [Hordeum vulgare]|nr:hypothetical protein ZWY2020_025375 [Hordeum vulgare]
MLVQLIDLSRKFEADQLKFKKGSEQDEHIAAEAELKIKSGHNTSKAAIEDLSVIDKKCAEAEARLEDITVALHKLRQEREQRQQAHLAHQSEMKNLVKTLQDAKTSKRTRLPEFEQETAALKTEGSELLKSVKNWRAP